VTIRIYFDEDAMDKHLVRALQARGVEVVYSVGEQMRRILKLIAAVSEQEMKNRVEFLSAWS